MKKAGDVTQRAIGCLYGQAIGDALGARYEFLTADEARGAVRNDRRGLLSKFVPILGGGRFKVIPGTFPIFGGGPFDVISGQVTDDTEQAMCLARALLAHGTFEKNSVAQNYMHWRYSHPFGIGNTTHQAWWIEEQPSRITYETIATRARYRCEQSKSNGCLMRVAPLAIAGAHWDREQLIEAGKADTLLTHPNEVPQDAVSCYLVAIKTLITSGGDAEDSYRVAMETCRTEEVRNILIAARKKAAPVFVEKIGEEVNPDHVTMGYCGIALQAAFFAMLHAESFERELVAVMKRGGDTDTNGCIVGAMLGAKFGAESIPNQWRKKVREARSSRLEANPFVDLRDIENVAVSLLSCMAPE